MLGVVLCPCADRGVACYHSTLDPVLRGESGHDWRAYAVLGVASLYLFVPPGRVPMQAHPGDWWGWPQGGRGAAHSLGVSTVVICNYNRILHPAFSSGILPGAIDYYILSKLRGHVYSKVPSVSSRISYPALLLLHR